MPIKEYTKEVKKRYSAGISTEHSYRGDLEKLKKWFVRSYEGG